MRRKLTIASVVSLCTVPMLLPSQDASAIPVFARKYQTSCYTCHSGFPTRNAFGEAFRNNGYRWPGGEDEDKSKQEQLKLGADGWKKTFPETPWPGEIPGYAPVSLWIRGDLLKFTQETTNPNGTVNTKQLLNNSNGPLGSTTLFFGGTMGDNLSAFGQYNMGATATAATGHLIWAFKPGINVAFGNGFTEWSFGNAISTYTGTFPTQGLGTEFTYTTGDKGGFKLAAGSSQNGNAVATAANSVNDLMYLRAKYKFGGAGLLSGAGGTYGNEFVGLDNHIALGATYVNIKKGVLTTGNYAGETAVYGADVTGNIGNLSLGAAYSRDQDLKLDNYRVDAIYFLYPWMKATMTYANVRSGDKANQPTVAAGVTAHLRANAYLTALYTYQTKERNTPTSVSNPDTFALTAGFCF
ncbi:MAG: porin [Chlorobiaceae bacterium]|nr:porin [Chlorobiaceae bacterium]